MTKPYYQKGDVTFYCGDAREILPELSGLETIITDPVWPNSIPALEGADRPYDLFREVCQAIPDDTERLVVQLGCDSDPRFLTGVPDRWPFLRVCWLDYARPSYKGRLLYTGDVGYIFGRPPAFTEGRQLMSGICTSARADMIFAKHSGKDNFSHRDGKKHRPLSSDRSPYEGLLHPAPRRLEHVRWLVQQFSDEAVCDPLMGSGTTAAAAMQLNRRFVGIEISERHCETAVQRCRQQVLDMRC